MSEASLQRVLHVTHSFFPEGAGGVESYLRDVVSAQRETGGVDARLFVGSPVPWPEVGVEQVELEGIPAWRVHRDDLYFDLHAKLYHPGVTAEFARVLDEFQPDVVHLHQWIRLSCDLVETADVQGYPVVVTLHDLYTSCPRCFRVRPGDEHCERPLNVSSCLSCVPRYGHESERELRTGIELFHDQYRAEIARARAVLVASEATAAMIAATTATPRESMRLLELAYRQRFAARPPEPAAAPAPLRFGYWGNLTERKGLPVLLEAFAKLCAEPLSRPVELHLFGRVDTEQLEARLQGLAGDLPVSFHGRFEYEQLHAAGLHVAVFPMVCFETYGFVLDEAFELGLPAVVTDIGAIPLRAGDAALRVPPRDPEAMYQAMLRLVQEPELLNGLQQSVGKVGLTLDEHLEALRQIYGEATQPRSAASIDGELARRRAELLLLQRESAQARITPEGGPQ